MEDLNIEEIKQLANFYRQKASDLELQVLQLQLKMVRQVVTNEDPVPATKISKNKIDS